MASSTRADQRHLLGHLPHGYLTFRLVARLRQAVPPDPRAGRFPRAATVGALTDLLVARSMRRRTWNAPGPWRVVGEALEQACWSATAEQSVDSAVLLGVPLSIELGTRGEPWSLATPLLDAVLANSFRRARGLRPRWQPFMWQGMGVLIGWSLVRYDRNRSARIARLHALTAEADQRRARIAGEQSVVLTSGRHSIEAVSDLLARTAPLLSVPGGSTYLSPVQVWREARAGEARLDAAYLGDVVTRWEADRNRSSPRLADDVSVTVSDGATALVLADQEEAMRASLDALALSGPVELSVDRVSQHIPGRPLNLDVTGNERWTVQVPAASRQVGQAVSPGAYAPVLMAIWCGIQVLPGTEEVPVRAVVPTTALCLATAARTYRRLDADDPNATRWALAVCTALAALHTVLATPAARAERTAEGLQPFPFIPASWAPLFLLALDWDRVPARERRAVGISLGLTWLLGLRLCPHPPRVRDLLLSSQWAAAAHLSARGWGQAFEAHRAEEAAIHEARRHQLVEEAFAEGAGQATALVAAAVADAEERYAAVCPVLDPAVRREARRRLDELAGRLRGLATLGTP